jgi:predicted TIM-barrel fold metal-dependent hydrolase
MTRHFSFQYEDIAASVDWRTETPKLDRRFLAISGDSHVTEPPEAYSRYIEPRFRDVAPHIVPNPNPGKKGEYYKAEGMAPFSFRTSAAAGMRPQDIDLDKGGFADMHRGGWDPKARLEAQDRDGILAEVIYPTIGMILCALPDPDYKQACFRAYNQWIRDFVQEAPTRLYGVGQTAVRSVKDAMDDLRQIRELGLKGVMMPSEPSCDVDYDHPDFDALWELAIELELPVGFHVLTGRGGHKLQVAKPPRGGMIAGFGGILRELQDVASLFIFGRIFERHPDLRIVLVESDAGWAPHFCSRMDHAYKRHRYWMKVGELSKLPSEFFHDNVYMTFQDDWVALKNLDILNPRRLLWANDYPHSDSTWPWSHQVLAHHMAEVPAEQADWILRENVKALYKLDVDTTVAG